MPNRQCRCSIALAAVAVALLWSQPAAAQMGVAQCHEGAWSNHPLVTGAYVEIIDQAKAERCLGHLEAKLQRDNARGNACAAQRDAYRIAKTRFRIGVDEWLIRYNTCQVYGPYPNPVCLDLQTRLAIGQYRGPYFGP